MIKFPQAACLLLGAIAAMFVAGCTSQTDYRHAEGAVWHTAYHITYGRSGGSTPILDDSIAVVLRRVELALSPFNDSSEVTALNRDTTAGRAVGAALRYIFEQSQMVNRISAGMFDPTVAPLVNLWGFGYKQAPDSAPDQRQIDEALSRVGIADCCLAGDTLLKKHPLTEFNFSAITKGFACDEVGRMMERNGVDNFMVEIGGEIALGGVNPRGGDWNIMIDRPIESNTEVIHERQAIVAVSNCGVATSGNYRNYRDIAGSRAGHTISPATGRPVATSTLSASVIAPSAMLADALATAAMAMPADSALAMASRVDGAELMLVVLSADTLATLKSVGWPADFSAR